MSFHEVRFPIDISFGSSGGPEYSTEIVATQSGYEYRNSNWSQARAKYNVAHGVRNKAQLDELIAFFRARKGKAHGFRFKDWADYAAASESIGTGDEIAVAFQLSKTYSSGSQLESRDITKPVDGSVKVYVDGVEQTTGFAVDYTTGIVTFDTAPTDGTAITADFEFDVPVRFDTDKLNASLESYGQNSWQDIDLVEVRI